MNKKYFSLFFGFLFMVGCASSQIKARKDLREKSAQSSKIYCDFVNGEIYPDVEVMVNIEMAKRCDSGKNFSLTQYKTSNENMGIVYCCGMADKGERKSEMNKSGAEVRLSPKAAPDAKAGKENAKEAVQDNELGE